VSGMEQANIIIRTFYCIARCISSADKEAMWTSPH